MAGSLFGGIKGGIALTLALPFIVVLTPLWFIHRWSEVRAGRSAPQSPLELYREKRRQAQRPLWYLDGDQTVFAREDGESEDAMGEDVTPVRLEEGTPHHENGYQEEAGREEATASASSSEAAAHGGVALVTGGGRRLGALMVRHLAARGWPVAIGCHRGCEAAWALVREIQGQGGKAAVLEADLTHSLQTEALLKEAERALGPVTLLINNAAWFQPSPLENPSWDVMGRMLTVNLQAPVWLAMKAAHRMRVQGGGQVINMADIWGLRPLQGHALYSASKAGLVMATQALARELAPEVRINAIAPGALLAPEDPVDRKAFQRLQSRTPLARYATSEQLLPALDYLLQADFVTGEVLQLDGGRRWA